jgi:hypothetical protein
VFKTFQEKNTYTFLDFDYAEFIIMIQSNVIDLTIM